MIFMANEKSSNHLACLMINLQRKQVELGILTGVSLELLLRILIARAVQTVVCALSFMFFAIFPNLSSLCVCSQVKPLIWVEAQVERHSRSRVEFTIKARSQFKERRYLETRAICYLGISMD
jgi:hypothetical protein